MNKIFISKMTLDDLYSISNILETEFDNFWNYNIFKSELENESSTYFIAKYKNEIIGIIGALIVLDEADITNIVVKKIFRNQGVATFLLKELIKFLNTCNIKKINLEVSYSNKPAIKLYEKFGFEKVGLRKNYYKNSDAILMNLLLTN